MSRFFFFLPFWCWLIVSLPPFLPHWAVTWFKVNCTGRYATGSSHKGRERERTRERREEEGRNAETEIPFSSPIPPFCSPTLSTQMILAADGGSTAPLQWDGGGRELQLSVYKPVVLLGQRCCQMGFDQRVLVICDSTVRGFSFQLTTTAGDFTLLFLCFPSCLKCSIQISCCCVWFQINSCMLHSHGPFRKLKMYRYRAFVMTDV